MLIYRIQNVFISYKSFLLMSPKKCNVYRVLAKQYKDSECKLPLKNSKIFNQFQKINLIGFV